MFVWKRNNTMNQQNETEKSGKRDKNRRYLLLILLLLILMIIGRCGAERHRVRTDFNKSVAEFECALDSINSMTDIEKVAELLLKLIDYEKYDYVEYCPDEYRKRFADTLIVKGDSLARGGIYADAVDYYQYALEFDNSKMAKKRIEACEGLQTTSELIGKEKFAEAKNVLANIIADSVVFDNIIRTLTDKCTDGIKLAEAITKAVRTTQQRLKIKSYVEMAFGANIEMVFVEGGYFETIRKMYARNRKYPYKGEIDSFYIGRYEITQEQWKKVMGTTLSQKRQLADTNFAFYHECYSEFEGGGDYPMTFVGWEDAMEFCLRLSQQSGKKYILPNEIQWQYAASGGVNKEKYQYSGSDNLDEIGWYNKNSGGEPHPVGQKHSNALGLYDMCGNVDEWGLRTLQEFDSKETGVTYYTNMGGNFLDGAHLCMISCINSIYSHQCKTTGFRICMIP